MVWWFGGLASWVWLFGSWVGFGAGAVGRLGGFAVPGWMDDLLGFGFGVLVIWVVGCFGWFGLHLRLCDRLVSGDGWAIWLYLAFGWCFAVCWVWRGLAGCCCAGLGLVGLGVLGLAGYCLVSYCGLW